MSFEFASAGRILFGPGSLALASAEIQKWKGEIVLVRGKNRSRAGALLSQIPHPAFEIEIAGEPTVEQIRTAMQTLKGCSSPVVVAMGGGGVLDAGKAIAGLLTNPGDPLDYLEVIGKGRPIISRAAPLVAIPTTAGTGSEVTRNAVLTSTENKLKVSMRSHLLLPEIACVDPELTLSMPPELTANTGMDALAQVLEPFVSVAANPLTDALCREGLRRARSLLRAFQDGADISARTDMAMTSLIGGIALANAKLGAVHGFASPIGGMFDAPHGAVCAVLLAPVMKANIRALRARDPSSPLLERYAQTAAILTGRADAKPEDGADWAADLCQALKISPLSSYGLRADHVEEVCSKAQKASSMKGNSIELTQGELQEILTEALAGC
jgi:alcohol dehydrogenase class IV